MIVKYEKDMFNTLLGRIMMIMVFKENGLACFVLLFTKIAIFTINFIKFLGNNQERYSKLF